VQRREEGVDLEHEARRNELQGAALQDRRVDGTRFVRAMMDDRAVLGLDE
jgi:hypothetical protein